jgi:hypothetical protein
MSRTQPPAKYAMYPSSRKREAISRAAFSIGDGFIQSL